MPWGVMALPKRWGGGGVRWVILGGEGRWRVEMGGEGGTYSGSGGPDAVEHVCAQGD